MHAVELLSRFEAGERDFRGADLQGAELAQADLRGADLRGAFLVRADLRAAHLDGANLRWANLTDAALPQAALAGADLSGATLARADSPGHRDAQARGGREACSVVARPTDASWRSAMLVLTRKPGEQFVLGGGITVTVVSVLGNKVRLAFDAPAQVRILRAELLGRQDRPVPGPDLAGKPP